METTLAGTFRYALPMIGRLLMSLACSGCAGTGSKQFCGTVTLDELNGWTDAVSRYSVAFSNNQIISFQYAYKAGRYDDFIVSPKIPWNNNRLARKIVSSGFLRIPDQRDLPTYGGMMVDGGWLEIAIQTSNTVRNLSYSDPVLKHSREDRIVFNIAESLYSQAPEACVTEVMAKVEQLRAFPKSRPMDKELVVAAYRLDVGRVKELISAGANVNARIGEHDTRLLMDMWTHGYPDNSGRSTPLLAVSRSNRYPDPERDIENSTEGLTKALEEQKRIPKEVLEDRARRQVHIANMLLDAGADINADDEHYLPVVSATLRGAEDLAVVLIERGADLKKCRDDLFYYGTKSARITQALLAAGLLDVSSACRGGQGPFEIAVVWGNKDVVKMLIDAGVMLPESQTEQIDLVWSIGSCSIPDVSAEMKAEVLKLLLAAGLNANLQDKGGRNLLEWAAREEQAPVLNVLLDAGADVNITNVYGQTPLHILVSGGECDTTLTRRVIAAGANVNAKDQDGNTPLHEAITGWSAETDMVEVVKMLIAARADVNARNNEGKTPLTDLMDYLEFKPSPGVDPEEQKCCADWKTVAELLVKAGAKP